MLVTIEEFQLLICNIFLLIVQMDKNKINLLGRVLYPPHKKSVPIIKKHPKSDKKLPTSLAYKTACSSGGVSFPILQTEKTRMKYFFTVWDLRACQENFGKFQSFRRFLMVESNIEGLLRFALDGVSDCVIILNENNRLVFANHRFCSFMEQSEENLLNSERLFFIDDDERNLFEDKLVRLRNFGEEFNNFVIPVKNSFQLKCFNGFFSKKSESRYIVGILREISTGDAHHSVTQQCGLMLEVRGKFC
jgi:PAS domain-containing protein